VKEKPKTEKTDTKKADPKTTDTVKPTEPAANNDAQIQSQSESKENRTNPDGQLQGEVYWDPLWNDEPLGE
jgi:hypothetical protein